MQILETELTDHGRTLKQIRREGRIAIYELHHPIAGLIGYEVIVIQFAKANTFQSGRSYPDREYYPKSEDWGTTRLELPNARLCRSAETI
jgi:hypothetical protein